MNNVQREEMLALPIPLAGIAEQKVIIQRVEKAFFMVEELEKQVSDRKKQSEQLMQAVLREAFEGAK
jgi:type I restriction enzyme S subunit